MAKQLVTLHMYECTDDYRKGVKVVDALDWRAMPQHANGKVWIGSTEVEIDFPEIDTRQLQIDALEAQVQQERAECQGRVNLLLERISKLRAIGHDA
jgi:hypothetical protein